MEKTSSINEIAIQFQEKGMDSFLTSDERTKYFNGRNYGRCAARFLAKQLILEHLELPGRFHDITITNDGYGRPTAYYSGMVAAKISATEGLTAIYLSLSHSKNIAATFVIFEYFYPGENHQ